MSYYKKIICRPLNDNNKRFLLGKNGTVEMMAIGLNPSKANEGKLDPTSRNIEKIANNNGCNGWWLVNLYPLRTANPKKLPIKPDLKLIDQNLNVILELIQNPKFKINKILCCWGNHVDDHLYLKLQASKILEFTLTFSKRSNSSIAFITYSPRHASIKSPSKVTSSFLKGLFIASEY